MLEADNSQKELSNDATHEELTSGDEGQSIDSESKPLPAADLSTAADDLTSAAD